jgi:MprA protease rhombosortase-interaction domain-containing protein
MTAMMGFLLAVAVIAVGAIAFARRKRDID